MGEDSTSNEFNSPAGLVDVKSVGKDSDDFMQQVLSELKQTEEAVLNYAADADSAVPDIANWTKANEVIAEFRPVPQFIWNISNYCFSREGIVDGIPEGLVFGLRRLLFGVASDPVLGIGEKVNKVRQALHSCSPDVFGAVAVIHAVCRRLLKFNHHRVWKPIIDDALLRARLGFVVGTANEDFGSGRGMLAGFSGRSGLAILLAMGELEQAQDALQGLAAGGEIRDVGLKVYGCDPLQVSAMALSAAGCGRDAAFGTVAYADELQSQRNLSRDSQSDLWFAAFTIIEKVRMGRAKDVSDSCWHVLYLENKEDQDLLVDEAKLSIRRGHGWAWIASS